MFLVKIASKGTSLNVLILEMSRFSCLLSGFYVVFSFLELKILKSHPFFLKANLKKEMINPPGMAITIFLP